MNRKLDDIALPIAETGRHSEAEQIATMHAGGNALDRLEAIAADSNLSMSQLMIWMGQKLDPQAPLYNMALVFDFTGRIDTDSFCAAFEALVVLSDAMRLVITDSNGIPQAKVLPAAPAALEILDLSKETDPPGAMLDWAQQRCERPFDLARCLYDSALIKTGGEQFAWYLNQHHLITDGGSKAATYQHMVMLYQRALQGQLEDAPALPAFMDYAAYEKKQRESASFEKSKLFWRKQADARPAPIRFYGNDPEQVSSRTRRVCCELGTGRTEAIKKAAELKEIRSLSLDMTLFQVFLTLLIAYLHRIDGRRDLRVGTPFHHRIKTAHKQTAGLFMEVFPSKVHVDDGETFLSLLEKVKAESNAVLRHAHPGAGNLQMHHSYGVVLNYINASFPPFDGLPVRCRWIHPNHGDGRHRLRLQVHDFNKAGSLSLHFDLNDDVFTQQAQGWVVAHFFSLLDAFLADPGQRIDGVSLLSAQEHDQVITRFNQTDFDYPRNDTVVGLFESAVAQWPQQAALQLDGREWTYLELDALANNVAAVLHDRGACPGEIVGVCMERSVAMVAALVGVLKTGAAYVPIDPALPAQRIAYMLEDSGASVVVVKRGFEKRVSFSNAPEIILIDNDGVACDGSDRGAGSTPPPAPTSAEDLAYVIYTSGSTGQPKGVMVEHRQLVNYLLWAKRQYAGDRQPACALYTSFSFDLTVTSIFLPLITGGRIVIYPEQDTGVDLSFLRVIDDDMVDLLKATPAHLALLPDKAPPSSRLNRLIVGGEDLKTALADKAARFFGPEIEIYNEYGPTEATVGCMIHRFDPSNDTGISVPIGVPAHNCRIYVLDRNLHPVPTGVGGELFVGGDCVTRGYLNQPELTRQKFIPDPFRSGQRMYRTGDLARRNARGLIEFLGRADSQVKIKGVRIELGEIEAAINSHPRITECVAVAVGTPETGSANVEVIYCRRCGLASNHPEARMNDDGVCALCIALNTYQDKARQYFQTMDELRKILSKAKAQSIGDHDCIMLYSGGKDSTYALYQLVEMGLKVLVFTLDNGFISDQAKANIRRVVDDLGLELVIGRPPAMNAIFVDSLERFSNVCQGCFKTIYTLGMNLARERGIGHIVTGLSRGQFFETRVAEVFRSQIFDRDDVDRNILEARKAYHRMDDAVWQNLDVAMFQDDTVFEQIQFIDFYRYCDAELDEMLAFLDRRAPWIRPSDTGRSTNCLINEAGIYVHKKKKGFHNYALPYSWDVRLGHKQRDEALQELDDEIDPHRVAKILHEIGYQDDDALPGLSNGQRLAVYFVATAPLTSSELRAYLADKLPDYMAPSYFMALDQIPLAPSGKIDRRSLPDPWENVPGSEQAYAAPQTPVERVLADIWAKALGHEKIGVHDNFIDLGGDSIVNIMIIAKANKAGWALTPTQLFKNPTVAQLAKVAQALPASEPSRDSKPLQSEDLSTDEPSDPASRFPLANLDDQKMSELAKRLEQIDGLVD